MPDSSNCLPDALIIGLGRAGTTWLQKTMEIDASVFVPAVKDTFFFDRNFHQGEPWYSDFFSGHGDLFKVEISHDYFFHPLAPYRVRTTLSDAVRVAVVLRKPSDWIDSVIRREISLGMHGRKTADDALGQSLGLIAAGFYANYLRLWQSELGRDRVGVFLYDDLRSDPDHFYKGLAHFLGYEPIQIGPLPTKVNEVRQPRILVAAFAAKTLAVQLRSVGCVKLVARLKRDERLLRSLWRDGGVASLSSEMIQGLDRLYLPGYAELGELADRDISALWSKVDIE